MLFWSTKHYSIYAKKQTRYVLIKVLPHLNWFLNEKLTSQKLENHGWWVKGFRLKALSHLNDLGGCRSYGNQSRWSTRWESCNFKICDQLQLCRKSFEMRLLLVSNLLQRIHTTERGRHTGANRDEQKWRLKHSAYHCSFTCNH